MIFKLFLTGKKGLSALLGFGDNLGVVSGVCIGLDKNVKNDYSEEIIVICRTHNIKYSIFPEVLHCDFDYVIAAGWQRMIKDVEQDSLIVFHDSLLPKYRGFAPLVNALLNDEQFVGLTVLKGASEYDKGDIYLQKKIPSAGLQSIEEAIDSVSGLYQESVQDLIIALNAKIKPCPQIESQASYSLWLDEEDYHIDWHGSSAEIIKHIQFVGFPYGCAYSYVDGRKVRIVKAIDVDDVDIERRMPGKVIFMMDGSPVVVCGRGLVKIIEFFFEDSESNQLRFRSRFK